VTRCFFLGPGLPDGTARALRAMGLDVVQAGAPGSGCPEAAEILTAAGSRVVVTCDLALAVAERPEHCAGVLFVALPEDTPAAVAADAVAQAVRGYVEAHETA
jgi:hypothetical protein